MDHRFETLESDVSDIKQTMVTKTDFEGLRIATRKDIDAFRAEMRKDFDDFRAETKKDIDGFRTETKKDIDGFRAEIRKDIADLRTEMYKAFGDQLKWIVGTGAGLGASGIVVMTFVLNNAIPRPQPAASVAPPPIVIQLPAMPAAPSPATTTR